MLRMSLIFVGLLWTTLAGFPGEAGEKDTMESVAVKNLSVNGIAEHAGDIIVGTNLGAYKVSGDGRTQTLLEGPGLPRAMKECFITQVVANSRGDVFAVVGAGGLRQGSDGVYRWSGSSWKATTGKVMILAPNSGESVTAIAVAPDDTLYITIYQGLSKPARMYRSSDRGENWEPILHNQDWSTLNAISAGPGNQVWLAGGGIYERWMLMTERGKASPVEWRLTTLAPKLADKGPPGTHHVQNFVHDRKGNVYALSSTGSKELGRGLFKTSDKGVTWQRIADDNVSQGEKGLAINGDDHLYYGTRGVIRRSLDGGKSWEEFHRPGNTFVEVLYFDGKGVLWAGTADYGRSDAGVFGLLRSKQSLGTGRGPGTTETTTKKPPEPTPPTPTDGMILEAANRKVRAGDKVVAPVWLINSKGVANMNFTVTYNPAVAVLTGATDVKGNLLGSALFEWNPKQPGLIRIGFAQSTGITYPGRGTVANLHFQAVGKKGDRTPLHLEVTTINTPSGSKPPIRTIDGSITIVEDELVQGDCDGDGVLTAADAQCALQMSVQLRPESLHMDLDHDGRVTSNDARLILDIRTGKAAK